jgi:hypothetical protein
MHDLAHRRGRVIADRACHVVDCGGLLASAQGASCMEQHQPPAVAWRRELRVKIVWALAAKLVGLTLLWMLFFRGHGS